jgi:hypothetical protein
MQTTEAPASPTATSEEKEPAESSIDRTSV